MQNKYKTQKLNYFNLSRSDEGKLSQRLKKYLPYGMVFTAGILISLCCTEMVLAADAKLDIDGALTSSTGPFITALKKYWTTLLILPAAGTALFSEGDLRQRAIRAGIGTGIAGMMMMGIIAFLGQ